MNNKLQKIYNNSPIWLQNLLISTYGIKIYYQRYRKAYRDAFLKYSNRDYGNLEEQQEIQRTELKRIIQYAYNNSVFYKQLYQNIDLSRINSVEDLKFLPIVEKDVFRRNIEKIYTIDEIEAIPSFTGGTTGKSLKVLFKKGDFQDRMAYLDFFKTKLGINTFKAKKATFSGREFTSKSTNTKKKFWRNNWIYNQRLYSTFDLTMENMPYYVDNLNEYKPEILNGFVSALYELSKFIERKKMAIKFIPKAIFTTSETLLPIHRELIERVFKAKIYNQYASAEGAPFITECKSGNLHYNIDTGVIETLNTHHGNEMLVTSFTSYGTPLIRYKIGDKITFKDGVCACGSCHPMVEKIEGRQVDYLISKTKGKISLSHLADVIKGMPNGVVNMQFIQNSLDEVEVKIVVDQSFYKIKDEVSIREEMKFRFGEIDIKINYVDEILREKSGKYSLIKNNLV